MKKLPISRAKELAKETGARGVIVLAFDASSYGITSYGATKAECGQMKAMGDDIEAMLIGGCLAVWR